MCYFAGIPLILYFVSNYSMSSKNFFWQKVMINKVNLPTSTHRPQPLLFFIIESISVSGSCTLKVEMTRLSHGSATGRTVFSAFSTYTAAHFSLFFNSASAFSVFTSTGTSNSCNTCTSGGSSLFNLNSVTLSGPLITNTSF